MLDSKYEPEVEVDMLLDQAEAEVKEEPVEV